MPGEIGGAGLLPGGMENPSLQPSDLGAPHLEGDATVVGVHRQDHPNRLAEGISCLAVGCFQDEPTQGFRLETGLIGECGRQLFQVTPAQPGSAPTCEEGGFDGGCGAIDIHGIGGWVVVDSCAGWAGAWEASADLNRPFWAKS